MARGGGKSRGKFRWLLRFLSGWLESWFGTTKESSGRLESMKETPGQFPPVCRACGGSGEEIPFPSESQLKNLPAAPRLTPAETTELKNHLTSRHAIFCSIDLLLVMNLAVLLKSKQASAADAAIQIESIIATVKDNLAEGQVKDALYNLLLVASHCVWACEAANYPFTSDVRSIVKTMLDDQRNAMDDDGDEDMD